MLDAVSRDAANIENQLAELEKIALHIEAQLFANDIIGVLQELRHKFASKLIFGSAALAQSFAVFMPFFDWLDQRVERVDKKFVGVGKTRIPPDLLISFLCIALRNPGRCDIFLFE